MPDIGSILLDSIRLMLEQGAEIEQGEGAEPYLRGGGGFRVQI